MQSYPLNFSLRHEVARLIVWHVVTRPVVPSAVSYADGREGNAPSRACGHGTHSHPTGTGTVRGRCICQHQAEMGLDAWYGEPRRTLAKRRDEHQAKDAVRLEPKGTGAGTGSREYPVMDTQRSRRRESTSPMRVNLVERGKPVSLLPEGR